MKIRQATFLASLCLTFLTACTFQGRETPDSAAPSKSKSLTVETNGSSSFALNAFQNVLDEASENENVVVSPLGIYRILGALALGADGKTKAEIVSAMGRADSDEEWTSKASELYRSLNDDEEIVLSGGLWIQKDLKINESYLERLRNFSDQEAQNVDFANNDATKTINDWFKTKTDGKIVDLLKDEVSSDARSFLADAIQFQGEWKRAFDPNSTRKSYFKGLGNEAKDVRIPAMWKKDSFPYCQGDGFKYLELPYRDDRYSMAILLPDEGRYAEFEKELTVQNLEKWRNDSKETEVRVLLPKFAVGQKTDLGNVLKKMGIVEAFENDANFNSLVDQGALKLGAVVQGAFLKIDEKGTEAAAGTGATLVLKSAPIDHTPKFYVDRPFLYFIRRNADGEIIFCGRFVDPTAALEESERANDKSSTTTEDDLGLVGIGGKIE